MHTVGLDQFGDDALAALRAEGDGPANQAVATFFDALDVPHSSLFAALVRSKDGLDDDEAPGVGAFAREVEPWPSWADPELVRHGQAVFGTWGLEFVGALWMAALPTTYACAYGAEPLVRTARLTTDPRRRYVETGQMIIDAMAPGALEPGAAGSSAVRNVRLMHAAVRHVLTHPTSIPGVELDPWDDAMGVPLNQEDLLGCMFAFSILSVEALGKTGVRLDPADAEAFVHVWNLIGHQIGIRPDLLPLDAADSLVIANRIFDRQRRPSVAGRELTAHAISSLQEMLVVKRLRGLPASGMRHYLGDDLADSLGVPAADWTAALFSAATKIDRPLSSAMSRFGGHHSIMATIGRRLVVGFEAVERKGDRSSFQVSSELRAAWGVGKPPT